MTLIIPEMSAVIAEAKAAQTKDEKMIPRLSDYAAMCAWAVLVALACGVG